MSCPFVQPDVTRLQLSTGDYIDVKRELNAGEFRRVWSDMVRDGVGPNGETLLNHERVGLTRVLAYLVGWSFVDAEGRPVPVSEAAILNVNVGMWRELVSTIDTHEQEQERQRDERKKNSPTGAPGLRAISG